MGGGGIDARIRTAGTKLAGGLKLVEKGKKRRGRRNRSVEFKAGEDRRVGGRRGDAALALSMDHQG